MRFTVGVKYTLSVNNRTMVACAERYQIATLLQQTAEWPIVHFTGHKVDTGVHVAQTAMLSSRGNRPFHTTPQHHERPPSGRYCARGVNAVREVCVVGTLRSDAHAYEPCALATHTEVLKVRVRHGEVPSAHAVLTLHPHPPVLHVGISDPQGRGCVPARGACVLDTTKAEDLGSHSTGM